MYRIGGAMSVVSTTLEVLSRELLDGMVRELERRGARPLPTLLRLSDAARELSVGMTKMRELVKAHVVMSVQLGGRELVPRSEIERLSTVSPPKVALTGKAARLAASLAKVREPIPGAAAAAVSVRNAKRPRINGTQDSDALRRRRR